MAAKSSRGEGEVERCNRYCPVKEGGTGSSEKRKKMDLARKGGEG